MQKLQHDDRLRVGDRVCVRRQQWRIDDVRPFERCQLLTLHGTGSRNQGIERRVVAPFDRVEPVGQPRCLRKVPMRIWRRQCRALVADMHPAGALQSALDARIDLLPYQLEPALAVMGGLGSRVLIADEVGLGKTIQAGLILAELRALGAADRVLVLAPAGLREQWSSELLDRFGIEATLVDMTTARRRAATLPVGLNPWSTFPCVVTSVDYSKRPEVLPAILGCHWDVVVVDEAHGITPGSDRHRAVSALTARASYVVLLTATPHNGDVTAFDALTALGETNAGASDGLLVFRRRRSEVAIGPKRRIHRIDVRASSAERRMHEGLERFSRALDLEHRGDPSVTLTLTMLHKRALSSARSLEASVRRRLADMASPASDPVVQLTLPMDDGGGELNPSDEAPGWTWPSLLNPQRERRLLENLADAAREAARRETKLLRLQRLLRRLDARRESAIVFTEYRDTLAHVQRVLSRPCALVHGGLSREERRSALDDFQSGRRTVLLATDAAGEGLNLHHTCRVVVNLELPWNPMRLEQRIGRVDRIGQARRVHAFNLIANETGEEHLFDRLAARVASARRAIGASDPLTPGTANHFDRLSATEAATTDLSAAAVPLVRLEAESTRERERLIAARAMRAANRRSQPPELFRPSIARARTPNTRATLGARVLVILRLACEDASGHTVATRLVPLLVRSNAAISRQQPAVFDALLRALEPELLKCQDDEWQAQTAATIERFWRTRVTREQSIVRAFPADGRHALQPGLFDRRAERGRAAEVDADLQHVSGGDRRIEAILRRSVVAPADVRAALVLVS